jgi:hypothetical protein
LISATSFRSLARIAPGRRHLHRLFDPHHGDASAARRRERGQELRGAARVRRAIGAHDEGAQIARPAADDEHRTPRLAQHVS